MQFTLNDDGTLTGFAVFSRADINDTLGDLKGNGTPIKDKSLLTIRMNPYTEPPKSCPSVAGTGFVMSIKWTNRQGEIVTIEQVVPTRFVAELAMGIREFVKIEEQDEYRIIQEQG